MPDSTSPGHYTLTSSDHLHFDWMKLMNILFPQNPCSKYVHPYVPTSTPTTHILNICLHPLTQIDQALHMDIHIYIHTRKYIHIYIHIYVPTYPRSTELQYIYIYIYICCISSFIYFLLNILTFLSTYFLLILSSCRIDLMIFDENWLINLP